MTTAISQFRNNILSEVPGCPIPLVDTKIVSAMREFCEQTNAFEKIVGAGVVMPGNTLPLTLPFTFTESASGSYYYITIDLTDYSILTGYDPISITMLRIDKATETPIKFTVEHTDGLVSDEMALIHEDGTRFYQFPDLQTLELFPFTEAEDDAEVLINLSLEPASGSTTVDDRFYNEWRGAIEPLALYHLQRMKERPWSDTNQAAINRAEADRKISEFNFVKRARRFSKRRTVKGYI